MDRVKDASKLITDMTLNGATSDELERAIKYSTFVIDLARSERECKMAEELNDIEELREKYSRRNK